MQLLQAPPLQTGSEAAAGALPQQQRSPWFLYESRATHNGLADKSGNACGSTSTGEVVANGCGITLYAPNVNLVRAPGWGRAEEVYGEDPHLTAELAVGMVTGLQGNAEGSTSGPGGGPLVTGACCKHFAASRGRGDFREILTGKAMKHRHRRAW